MAIRGFWDIGVWGQPVSIPVAVVLFVLTFVLGIPTATWWTVTRFRSPLLVVAGFAGMVAAGLVEPFAGPLGLPWIVAAPAMLAFGGAWVFAFATITHTAWMAALSKAGKVDRDGGEDAGNFD